MSDYILERYWSTRRAVQDKARRAHEKGDSASETHWRKMATGWTKNVRGRVAEIRRDQEVAKAMEQRTEVQYLN